MGRVNNNNNTIDDVLELLLLLGLLFVLISSMIGCQPATLPVRQTLTAPKFPLKFDDSIADRVEAGKVAVHEVRHAHQNKYNEPNYFYPITPVRPMPIEDTKYLGAGQRALCNRRN